MKVALLTMFNGISSTYSIVNVAREHLKMLLDARVETTMLVSEHCPDHERYGIFADPRLHWKKVVNTHNGKLIRWRDYSQPTGKVHDTFFEEAQVIADDLVNKLADTDVCILHDIHYQGWHLVHNVAVRMAQEKLPLLRFIAFTHSAPIAQPEKKEWPRSARFESMPNTVYVYPTKSGLPFLAQQYGIPESLCKAVNNSLSVLDFLHEDVKKLAGKTDLISPDVLIVYPARLTPGKKFEKTASLAGAIQSATGQQVKVVFCDFPSMDIRPDTYKKIIRRSGKARGLEPHQMVFTSDLGYPTGFPRQAVLDLFTLSNLFICPSYSESFGLTVLEAASRGNYIVVNEAVPALAELADELSLYRMKWDARNFGFDTKETYHPSEAAYLEDHARIIHRKMNKDHSLQTKTLIRKRYSPEWVWEHQLKPLINNHPAAKASE